MQKNKKEILVLKNVNLANFCTFKLGGKAKFVCLVFSCIQLNNVCLYCITHNLKFKVIGLGANLLFDDAGFNGVIIVNKTSKILFKNNCVFLDSGVVLASLIVECVKRGLAGIEKLAGIPSTIGGAVVNGLGAFGVEFCNFVEYVECLNLNTLKKIKLKNSACKFGYRTSIFKSGQFLILRVKLKLNFGNIETIKSNMLAAIKQKAATQPLNHPSAGSVFKRFYIENKKTNKFKQEFIPAKIIDELGLKGLAVGGAMVSTKHAGFIVNTGAATSGNVLTLIEKINQKVQAAYGFTLPLEIEIVN